MIHIKENRRSASAVDIKVDGILDTDSVATLETVLQRNLTLNKDILLQLQGIIHIDRDGMDFLKKHRNRIARKGLSEFMRLELGLSG